MEICFIRQPIVDREQNVFGYELLFRDGSDDVLGRIDPGTQPQQLAARKSHISGLQTVCEGRKCVVPVSTQQILQEDYTSLPAASTVLELTESDKLDTTLATACETARKAGYSIALKDFVIEPRQQPLLDCIDLLKVDFTSVTNEHHRRIVECSQTHRFETLAENIQTPDDFQHAVDLGYRFFQGSFYCQPNLNESKQLATSAMQFLRLLQAVNQPELQIDQIDALIRQDVTLSVKLLKYLNSSIFSLRSKVGSIRQAVALMGHRPLRNWVSLITVGELSAHKPRVLMNMSLIRAKFCEAIGTQALPPELASSCFLMGILSLLDAILDQPMPLLLEQLSLTTEITAALQNGASPLRQILELVKALEDGDWRWINGLNHQLGLQEETIFREYRNAVVWASDVFKGLS
jgi:EAL and modified HD-GYP domain-containing signal transduction protein